MSADVDLTRKQLYEQASALEIPGRSKMDREALARAVRAEQGASEIASRYEAFEQLARRAANGEPVLLPRHLQGEDRRRHVRQTLREDHQTRIANNEETRIKFDELADSLFSFFRGTALLFYRDMAGEDGWMPTVLTLGDVHPENFGVMPNANNVPIFGVNDFDEAYYAPFTWDLKRGAVGFMLAAEAEGGYGPGRQRKIARAFVRGYVEAMKDFVDDPGGEDKEMREDNAPELVRELIRSARKTSRKKWLKKKYLDEKRRGFRSHRKIVPVTDRVEVFQEALERLVRDSDIQVPARAGELRVKDVAERKGQGTASLGLARYYLLIEGPSQDGTDDLVLELKRARRSALAGLVPPNVYALEKDGARIAHAQSVQLVRGDVFYGHVELDGLSFMSRERAPFRDDIDLDDLSKKEWKAYARLCGRCLAHAHALSDDTGRLDYDIEPAILEAIGPEKLFVQDILRYAEEAHARVRDDHRMFREDHALGAFHTVDRRFR